MFPSRSTGVGDEPMVARWGSEHPAAPLVVVLHGNGTSEHSMIEISPWLPHGPVAYAAVRAPLPAERGYRWFAETGGRPDPDGLAAATRYLLRWLDGEGDRPVLLLAFRSGVTLAGALMLTAPDRFSGAVLLHGALPLDPAPQRGALRGMPVLLAHAEDDPRTPQPLLVATRDWLRRRSGAPVRIVQAPGGLLAGSVVDAAGNWLGDRLDHLREHGESPLPDGPEPEWPGILRLPERAGEPPETTTGLPHLPIVSSPDPELWDRIAGLGTSADATIGPPGTRSLLLPGAAGPAEAFLHGSEFAHLHPDGSLHLCLPLDLAYDALVKGWGLAHPLAAVRLSAGLVLCPAPRDAAEREIVVAVVSAAHRYALA
jgi:phospholipase/carboxylesterase